MMRQLSIFTILGSMMVVAFAGLRNHFQTATFDASTDTQANISSISTNGLASDQTNMKETSIKESDLKVLMRSLYQADQFVSETTIKYLGVGGQRYRNSAGRVLSALKSTFSSAGITELNRNCQSTKSLESMVTFTEIKPIYLNAKPLTERTYEVQRVQCGSRKSIQVLASVKIESFDDKNRNLKLIFYNDQLISGVGHQFALINPQSKCDLLVNEASVVQTMNCQQLGQDINRARHLEIQSVHFDQRNEFPIIADMVVKENAVEIFETAAFKVPAQGPVSLVIQQAKAEVIEEVIDMTAPVTPPTTPLNKNQQTLSVANLDGQAGENSQNSVANVDANAEKEWQVSKDSQNPADSLGINKTKGKKISPSARTAAVNSVDDPTFAGEEMIENQDVESASDEKVEQGVEFVEISNQR